MAAAVLALAISARGQTPVTEPSPPISGPDEEWSFGATTYYYSVPHERNYWQPTVTADLDWLHLEARYNYEDADTGSLWVGYNLSGGDEPAWAFTPMLGGVFGDTDGIAPGYEGSLGWSQVELYMEGEYLFASGDSSDNFFYNWSELTYAVSDEFRFGLVAQHTRLYHSDRDIQRGVLVGFTWEQFDFTTSVLNPDDDAIFILGASLSF